MIELSCECDVPACPHDDINPGTLGLVPGQYIAQGSRALPGADADPQDEFIVHVDAGWAGKGLITYLRQRLKPGKQSRWVWVAMVAAPFTSGRVTDRPLPAAIARPTSHNQQLQSQLLHSPWEDARRRPLPKT